jgi:hypothetical protein
MVFIHEFCGSTLNVQVRKKHATSRYVLEVGAEI